MPARYRNTHLRAAACLTPGIEQDFDKARSGRVQIIQVHKDSHCSVVLQSILLIEQLGGFIADAFFSLCLIFSFQEPLR